MERELQGSPHGAACPTQSLGVGGQACPQGCLSVPVCIRNHSVGFPRGANTRSSGRFPALACVVRAGPPPAVWRSTPAVTPTTGGHVWTSETRRQEGERCDRWRLGGHADQRHIGGDPQVRAGEAASLNSDQHGKPEMEIEKDDPHEETHHLPRGSVPEKREENAREMVEEVVQENRQPVRCGAGPRPTE